MPSQPAASLPPRLGRRRGTPLLRTLVGAAGMLVLAAACADLPPPSSAAQPLPKSQVRDRVAVVGAQGPVTGAQKQRELDELEAEGRAALVRRHLGVLASLGELHLYRANSARLLVDGPQTFAAMKAAISEARRRVLLETYIMEDQGVAAEIGELLLRKAAEGVSVALMYDSVGSLGTDAAFFDRLRSGGVAVCAFNPVNPLQRPGRWGLIQRNHRKMLAVDHEVAFTGGINISEVYSEGSGGSGGSGSGVGSGGPTSEGGWRDTQIELRGPVVSAMVSLFRESWLSQDCPDAVPPGPAATDPEPGQRVVKLIAGDPEEGVNPTYTALLAAVGAAQRSVHLTMAYFAPGPDMVQALGDAARRGVEVMLVLPGRSDVKLVMHAARSYYAQMLESGVQIFEMRDAVMHAKTAVIDGVFSSVGSSNLDWRSIVGNNEIDVIVLGEEFGQALEALFRSDVARSSRIDPVSWRRRGVVQRLLEAFARLVEPLL
jgi:cardiolipin synthase A/B